MENSFKNFNNGKPKKHWDGKKEVGNPDAYDGYTAAKKQRQSVDITPEPSESRTKISRTTTEKVWDGRQAASDERYGTKKFKNIASEDFDESKYLRDSEDQKGQKFKGLNTKNLKNFFEETRDRLRKKAKAAERYGTRKKNLTKNEAQKISKERGRLYRSVGNDYSENYDEQAQALESRGALVKKEKLNVPELTRFEQTQITAGEIADKSVELFQGMIKDKKEEFDRKEFAHLGHTDQEFIDFEIEAKEKFQAMNTVIKDLKSKGIDHINDDAYFNARIDWMNAKARVEAHEESYRNTESQENQG